MRQGKSDSTKDTAFDNATFWGSMSAAHVNGPFFWCVGSHRCFRSKLAQRGSRAVPTSTVDDVTRQVNARAGRPQQRSILLAEEGHLENTGFVWGAFVGVC